MTERALDLSKDPPPDANTKASRPRDAATLIVVRRDSGAPQVLMGRRHGGHSFMPDKWVFPGGRLDRADFRAPYAADLRPEVAARLGLTANETRGRALAMAAVRETFEETGLFLARASTPRPGAGPWRDFLSHGALPDLSALEFVARAITPPYRAKRFDARFFIADAERLMSLERLPDCGELDEIAWFNLKAAADLDLPAITRFILKDLVKRLDDPGRPAPFVRFVRGKQVITHL